MTARAPDAGSLAAGVLAALAVQEVGTPVSLPRLGKQLQLEASVLLRELSLMGQARIGTHQGPGWVDVAHDGQRWLVRLTPAGAMAAALGAESATDDHDAPPHPAA